MFSLILQAFGKSTCQAVPLCTIVFKDSCRDSQDRYIFKYSGE